MIVNDITCDTVLDCLIEDDVLSFDDLQVINACPTELQKNRKLMDKLLRRSEKAFNAFLSALRNDYEECVHIIEKTNVTDYDVSTFQSCIK